MLTDCLLKTKKEYKNLDSGDSRYIYQNEVDKACFQHELTYGNFKDFSIKYYVIKNLILLNIKKHDGYQRGLASMVYEKSYLLCVQLNLQVVLLKVKIC